MPTGVVDNRTRLSRSIDYDIFVIIFVQIYSKLDNCLDVQIQITTSCFLLFCLSKYVLIKSALNESGFVC